MNEPTTETHRVLETAELVFAKLDAGVGTDGELLMWIQRTRPLGHILKRSRKGDPPNGDA